MLLERKQTGGGRGEHKKLDKGWVSFALLSVPAQYPEDYYVFNSGIEISD